MRSDTHIQRNFRLCVLLLELYQAADQELGIDEEEEESSDDIDLSGCRAETLRTEIQQTPHVENRGKPRWSGPQMDAP